MEFHPHHGSPKSWKEFFVDLSMVVLGILIALGIEQVREHFHERNLANDARANFAAEVKEERVSVTQHLAALNRASTRIGNYFSAGASGADSLDDVATQWQFLPTGAWNTAIATQAFSFMRYDEVQLYSNLHADQQIFNDFEDKYHQQIMELAIYKGRKNLSPGEKRERDHLLQLIAGYMHSIDQIGQELLTTFDQVEHSRS